MKSKVSIICLVFFLFCLTHNAQAQNSVLDSIFFEETTHDFGEIKQDVKVKHLFVFQNLGDSSVYIQDVVTQCGCTVGKYSQEPVAAGDTSELNIIFESTGKYGRIRKTIRVIFSNGKEVKLIITAQVVD
jgi:hypothetical protein